MLKSILNNTFSLIGVSLLIAVSGFSSSIVTMFVNVDEKISVKWLILVFIISTTVIVILSKTIFDLWEKNGRPSTYERIICFIPSDQLVIIKRNENFTNNTVVGCYNSEDDVERLAYIGLVYHVQEHVIQIKILEKTKQFDLDLNNKQLLKNVIVRHGLPYEVIRNLFTKEASHG